MRFSTRFGAKDDPLLEVALELERIALHDDYFIEKKLYPNIDFYSGITLKAMGFPTAMFHRSICGGGRTVGWISQWKEMIEDFSKRLDAPASSIPARRSAITSLSRAEADFSAFISAAPLAGATTCSTTSSTTRAARIAGLPAESISKILSSRENASI